MHKPLYKYLKQFLSDNKIELFEKLIDYRTQHITVVLEDIYQAHNASAVLRSCDCFGIQNIHIIENRNKYQPYRNASAGSNKWVTQTKYNKHKQNTVNCINTLKDQGFKIIATTPHKDSVMIDELPLHQKIALVFGTEKEGISQEVMNNADGFVRIPMYGFTESYNVSVAAALSLYQIKQNLNTKNINWKLNDEEKYKILSLWAIGSINNGEKLASKYIKDNS